MESKKQAQEIREYFLMHQQEMLSDLEMLVKAQSPSNNKQLLDICGCVL